ADREHDWTLGQIDRYGLSRSAVARSRVKVQFGRTEVIDNTLNPDFVRKFVLDFFFEEKQNLRFDVYNVDTRSSNISKHDFLGQMFCTLGEIIGSTGSRLERTLSGIPGKKCGNIIFTAEELSNCRDIATMQLCANKLDKKDFFGKSDPFLVFYRSNEDGTFTICHKTEVIKNTLNPVWQPFTIPVRALCNGDYDRCYSRNYSHSHDFIGEFTTSYREFSRGQNFPSPPVSNPSQPTSLHYMSPYQMNAYAMALKAVGEIIQDYDSDKMFPAYGFGAKLPPDGKISHAFPLNSNSENPNCVGIEGVLEAYFQSLRTVQLYGPTNFAPVINQVARCAEDVTDGSQYFVLLMITDGVISDMVQTKEAVVNAAGLPMSIIIVGVGPAEFDGKWELRVSDSWIVFSRAGHGKRFKMSRYRTRNEQCPRRPSLFQSVSFVWCLMNTRPMGQTLALLPGSPGFSSEGYRQSRIILQCKQSIHSHCLLVVPFCFANRNMQQEIIIFG
uniref:Copine family member 9 n=1 Tax=Hucho hucho TaxID=62062 RepID=A0A4W5RWY3_9TELE